MRCDIEKLNFALLCKSRELILKRNDCLPRAESVKIINLRFEAERKLSTPFQNRKQQHQLYTFTEIAKEKVKLINYGSREAEEIDQQQHIDAARGCVEHQGERSDKEGAAHATRVPRAAQRRGAHQPNQLPY